MAKMAEAVNDSALSSDKPLFRSEELNTWSASKTWRFLNG
jgi:hypothetical protein